ncbi:hypothetical protein ACLOJK_029573, partial [Asimina triloba]
GCGEGKEEAQGRGRVGPDVGPQVREQLCCGGGGESWTRRRKEERSNHTACSAGGRREEEIEKSGCARMRRTV